MLNAFRHHWNSHWHSFDLAAPKNLCSTPFGIIGIRTRFNFQRRFAFLSAQRLSASLEFAHNAQFVTSAHYKEVLNAFRHHWNSHRTFSSRGVNIDKCSTPFGINGIRTTGETGSGAAVFASAQRLSASLEFARNEKSPVGSLWRVLNAFRHHWNSHSFCRPAFVIVNWCSTPFGIMEFARSKK